MIIAFENYIPLRDYQTLEWFTTGSVLCSPKKNARYEVLARVFNEYFTGQQSDQHRGGLFKLWLGCPTLHRVGLDLSEAPF